MASGRPLRWSHRAAGHWVIAAPSRPLSRAQSRAQWSHRLLSHLLVFHGAAPSALVLAPPSLRHSSDRRRGRLPPLGTSRTGLGACSSTPSPSWGTVVAQPTSVTVVHLSKQSCGPALQPGRHAAPGRAGQTAPARAGPSRPLGPALTWESPKGASPVGGTRRPGGRGRCPWLPGALLHRPRPMAPSSRDVPPGAAPLASGPRAALTQGPAGWAMAAGDMFSSWPPFQGVPTCVARCRLRRVTDLADTGARTQRHTH